MLIFSQASQAMQALLLNRDAAVAVFRKSGTLRPMQLLGRFHVPLMSSYLVGMLACPLLYIQGWDSFKYLYILAFLLLLGPLGLAYLVDRLFENAGYPQLEDLEQPHRRNIALYVHLPLAGAGIFFLLHPALGILVQLLAVYYSFYSALESLSMVFRVSRARVLIHTINAMILIMLPGLVLAVIVALLRIFKVLSL